MSIPQCIILEIPDTLSRWYHIYDFDWVFLELPLEKCIVGMLLTCPINCKLKHWKCCVMCPVCGIVYLYLVDALRLASGKDEVRCPYMEYTNLCLLVNIYQIIMAIIRNLRRPSFFLLGTAVWSMDKAEWRGEVSWGAVSVNHTWVGSSQLINYSNLRSSG